MVILRDAHTGRAKRGFFHAAEALAHANAPFYFSIFALLLFLHYFRTLNARLIPHDKIVVCLTTQTAGALGTTLSLEQSFEPKRPMKIFKPRSRLVIGAADTLRRCILGGAGSFLHQFWPFDYRCCGCLSVQRNSVPSTQMRCMITASRRASASARGAWSSLP